MTRQVKDFMGSIQEGDRQRKKESHSHPDIDEIEVKYYHQMLVSVYTLYCFYNGSLIG